VQYREEGFAGTAGKASPDTKREAKYLIVCDQVVFFAAYYKRAGTQEHDPKLLRLSFTVHRNELRLPARSDDDSAKVPHSIDVFASDKVSTIPLEKYSSWVPLLDRVVTAEEQATSHDARLAAATWELHRMLELSAEKIKQFPVKVRKVDGGAELRLDGARFSDLVRGPRGFIYKLLLNTKDRITFFCDTVEEWREDLQAGGRKLLFVRQGN